jgi:hypothetical protein
VRNPPERHEDAEAEQVQTGSEGAGRPRAHDVAKIAGRDGSRDHQRRVRVSYDTVTDAYVERVHGELVHKPLDRALLTAFAEQVLGEFGPGASICDAGCGPGHVGAFLADQGVIAFYSIIHLTTDDELRAALREFHRTLADGGFLLVAVHIGEEGDVTVHSDDMLGASVDMEFRFFDVARFAAEIRAAGFMIVAQTVRAPYPDVEVQTTRAYLMARRSVPSEREVAVDGSH